MEYRLEEALRLNLVTPKSLEQEIKEKASPFDFKYAVDPSLYSRIFPQGTYLTGKEVPTVQLVDTNKKPVGITPTPAQGEYTGKYGELDPNFDYPAQELVDTSERRQANASIPNIVKPSSTSPNAKAKVRKKPPTPKKNKSSK